jgi:pilus assembly protein FimV
MPEPLQANAELTNEKTSEDTGKPSATATTESIKLPKKSQPKLSTSKKPAASPNTAEKLDHYTTKKGDSLNAIAVRYRAESVSLEQMLVGLFNANKAAFAGSNMNRLKAGEEIKIPGLDTLQTISQAEAVEEIRVQAEDWETYRMNLAGLAKGEKSSSEQNPAQISTGKVIALSGQDSAQTATEPRDVVKLSTGGAHDGKSNIQKPSEQIAALQDEAVARARELKEAGENTKQLEKQVRDMSKLITIKNQMLAQKSNIHNDSRTSLLGFVTKHIWIALGGVSLLLGLLIAIRLTLRSKKKNLSD